MQYWVHKDTRFEGWRDKAICAVKADGQILSLSKEEKELIFTCDGREQSESALANRLLENGIITTDEAVAGEAVYNLHNYVYRETAVIAVTGRCNYACKHCIAADSAQNPEDELSYEEVHDIMLQMRELGMRNVMLTGGEPLLHPHFIDIVRDATELGLRIKRINTNGSLLTSEILSLLKECGQSPEIGISFDGLGTHDYMRGIKGAEETALRAIELALSEDFNVIPHINVNQITAPRMIETCRALVNEHKCNALRLILTNHSPRWLAQGEAASEWSFDDYFALMLELIRTCKEENWGTYLNIFGMPPTHNKGSHGLLQNLKNPPKVRMRCPRFHICDRTFKEIFISHDGRVVPCSGYEANSKRYGFLCDEDINIRQHTLKEILSDSEYAQLAVETIGDYLEYSEKCRDCKWLGICQGGCPLYGIANSKNCLDENLSCSFYSNGWADKYIKLIEEIIESGEE